MPKIHTHLHLGLMLLNKITIINKDSFLLGNAYPDCWNESIEDAIKLHYKKEKDDDCDLDQFLNDEEKDDFHFGYYFHLWVDNYIKTIDLGDITSSDCLILDSEIIACLIHRFDDKKLNAQEKEAYHHIQQLEKEPMLLYLVPEDKKLKYTNILNQIIQQFVKEMENNYES